MTTQTAHRYQLAFYQEMILLKPFEGMCNESVDTRQRCLLCEKKRLTGHQTNKGFLCYLCQNFILNNCKKKGIEFAFKKRKQRTRKKPDKPVCPQKVEVDNYRILFAKELMELLNSVEIPPTLLLTTVSERLKRKGITPPKTVSLCNLASKLRHEGMVIPKQPDIFEQWKIWTRKQLAENVGWDKLINQLQKNNEWSRHTAIEFVKSLAKELGKMEDFSSYLNRRRSGGKQTTVQLTLIES